MPVGSLTYIFSQHFVSLTYYGITLLTSYLFNVNMNVQKLYIVISKNSHISNLLNFSLDNKYL